MTRRRHLPEGQLQLDTAALGRQLRELFRFMTAEQGNYLFQHTFFLSSKRLSVFLLKNSLIFVSEDNILSPSGHFVSLKNAGEGFSAFFPDFSGPCELFLLQGAEISCLYRNHRCTA